MFLAGLPGDHGLAAVRPVRERVHDRESAAGSGQYLACGLFLLLLAVVFVGMGATVLAVVQGTPPEEAEATRFRDSVGTAVPILLFLALVLLLGLYIPPPLESLLREAAASLEVKR